MTQILAAYCINVTDIERSIEFWDGVMGIPLQSRTEIDSAHEAVLQAPRGLIGTFTDDIAPRREDLVWSVPAAGPRSDPPVAPAAPPPGPGAPAPRR